MELADAFRFQAAACGQLGSPMYAELLDRAARDIDDGGPVAELLDDHADDPGPSALALRLLGSVHRLVLERRAGELAVLYPSVGGTWEPEKGWAVFRELVRARPAEVREWLDRPPQTNEVGRSTALYGGLLHLPRDLPVRLLEIGASAGLNLNADRFAYLDTRGHRAGDPAARLLIANAWHGRPLEDWPDLHVVERVGCDPHPVDVSSPEGRLLLTAYVWPDQRHRLERLRAALQVAQEHPVEVRRQDARSFMESVALKTGVTTVLWHSVMWQYLSPAEQAAVLDRLDELGQTAGRDRRLAHLRAEPSRRAPGAAHEFLVRLRVWPEGEDRLLGATVGHGVPTTWEEQPALH